MTKEEAKELLARYNSGDCTDAERLQLEAWFYQLGDTTEALSEEKLIEMGSSIQTRLDSPRRRLELWPIIGIAAAITAIMLAALFYFRQPVKDLAAPVANDINPGGNKAILTLANGQQINLSDASTGTIAAQAGLEILKDKDGQISYKVTGSLAASGDEYHTITTPVGGQYTITLPDGSKIWLNAASSLRYPSTFAKESREVQLSGEAYFEIAKDKKRPFVVNSATQQVQVLGTHFNVSAYSDEPAVKTTLLEGSVKITPSANSPSSHSADLTNPSADLQIRAKILHPNQQSILSKNTLKIKAIDPAEAIAWKNGEFIFDQEDLTSIMKKVARWYDIEVIYQDNGLKTRTFSGSISRFEKVSELLRMLETTGSVNFRIEGRKVLVMK